METTLLEEKVVEEKYTEEEKAIYKENMGNMKVHLKKTGEYIKLAKVNFKDLQRNGKSYYKEQSELLKMRWDFRHNHIAYSELRGNTRDVIEKPSEFNKPSEKLISNIKEKLLTKQ